MVENCIYYVLSSFSYNSAKDKTRHFNSKISLKLWRPISFYNLVKFCFVKSNFICKTCCLIVVDCSFPHGGIWIGTYMKHVIFRIGPLTWWLHKSWTLHFDGRYKEHMNYDCKFFTGPLPYSNPLNQQVLQFLNLMVTLVCGGGSGSTHNEHVTYLMVSLLELK